MARMCASLKAPSRLEPRCPDVPKTTFWAGFATSGVMSSYALSMASTWTRSSGCAGWPARGCMTTCNHTCNHAASVSVRGEQLLDRCVVVGQDGRVTDKAGGLVPELHVRLETAGNRRYVDRPVGPDHHVVATALPGELVLPGDDRDVREHGLDGLDLGFREQRLAVVDDVDQIDAVRPQHSSYVADQLPRGQMPRHGQAAERVHDDQVPAVGFLRPHSEPAVLHCHRQVRTGPHTELSL